MDYFDEHLAFDLPDDYMVERNEDEDGNETFKTMNEQIPKSIQTFL